MQKESKRQDSEANLSRRTGLGLLNCQELIHNLKTQIDSRKNMKNCNPLESRLSVSGKFKNVCRHYLGALTPNSPTRRKIIDEAGYA